MKNESAKWKVGMFVIIGFVIFIIFIYVIGKQRNLFGSTIHLQTVFKTVNGLEVGNNVRFSGINVGTVDGIQLINDTTVRVAMVIQKDIQKYIKKDASASIGSEGLMGDKVLIITPGTATNQLVQENDMIISKNPVEAEQIMASVRATAQNAETITAQLAQFTYKLNNSNGPLSKLIGDDKMAQSLNRTMTNLEASSKGLSENMEAAKHNFLLRGYFKKKEKERQKKIKEAEKIKKED